MTIDPKLQQSITANCQEHLLKYWNDLDDSAQQEFARQLNDIDFDNLSRLIPEYVLKKPETQIPADLAPAPFYPHIPVDAAQEKLYQEAEALGKELLSSGRVCFLTVAGGQGTRLGFNAPKGTYPIGPVSGKSLFGYFAESLLRAGNKYGQKFSWYIMTSMLNHQDTVNFFKANDFFGLDEDQLFFFSQGTMPAIGYDGKLLMSSKGSLSLSPDGHGGTLLALRKSGALQRMIDEKTDIISYFQVDNPLIQMTNPRFIGLHAMEKAQMSAVMLAKTGPYEKLGNFCVSNNRLQIIEYSDLPSELAEMTTPEGKLVYLAGSPAIHLIDRDFIGRLTAGNSLKLPWHRADKKIPSIDCNGNPTAPDAPNGVKLESFIFDALPLAEKTMVLECDRNEVFAPTKNPTGVDSVESCRMMLIARDARRLEQAGVTIPRDASGKVTAAIEISPKAVLDDEDAIEYVKHHAPLVIESGKQYYFE